MNLVKTSMNTENDYSNQCLHVSLSSAMMTYNMILVHLQFYYSG